MGARYLAQGLTPCMPRCCFALTGCFPERDMGERIARSMVNPHVLDLINLPSGYQISWHILPDT